VAKGDWLRAVGLNVLLARTNAGKNQADLGVSPTTVAKFERGGGGTLLSIQKIAATLKTTPELLLRSFPDAESGEHDPFIAEVVRMFSDPTRRRLMHLIGSLKDEQLDAFEAHANEWRAAKPRDRLQPRRKP
jgi:transcriptional regulator with XRE-family HTH domain